ncbi:MAG TPA: hypothetical protein ENN20_10980 [Candidatus Marinimicrobia bacterium]|nr:hypothetical protein [Candidatus Neomarinimicrobiota bacterium]
MKESPQTRFLQSNLQASKFSAGGFLGNDQRPIDEIIADDLRQLEEIGRTVGEVVQLLKNAYEKIRSGLGNDVELSNGVTGRFYESMGRIPSPFRGDGVFEKGEAVVTDENSGDSLIITKLGIHLIEKHHFFQGVGCRYRIEPQQVFQILTK